MIPNLKDGMTALSCFEQRGAISGARGGRTENTNTVVAAVGVVGGYSKEEVCWDGRAC